MPHASLMTSSRLSTLLKGLVPGSLLLLGCASADQAARPTTPTGAISATSTPAPEPAPVIDLALARRFMSELDAACIADGAQLWGRSLAGPLIFADPQTREAVANRRDPAGVLRPKGDLFVGVLPDEVLIANTGVDWGGVRWTMVMWGALADTPDAQRRRLLAHEAFHRLQPELGLEVPTEVNAHLDTKDGRLLMQLEWNALEAALGAQGAARTRAIRDALAFRRARQARFPQAKVRESQLEIHEGLAEYTGARLAGDVNADVVESVRARRRSETGFVRSFAYVSGPLYGYLLDGASPDWRQKITRKTDLGALLGELAHAPPSEGDVHALGARYDGAALLASEEARAKARDAQIASWRKALVDGPILIVPLEGGDGTFDPRLVFPISETETVYTSRELRGTWGSLAVDEAPMLQDAEKGRATVSLDGADPHGTRGKSWTLKLAPGWTTAPGERPGDLTVIRK